jgi:hypothetical protein
MRFSLAPIFQGSGAADKDYFVIPADQLKTRRVWAFVIPDGELASRSGTQT